MTRSLDQTWRGAAVLLPHGAVINAHLVLRRGKISGVIPADQPAPGSPVEAEMAGYLVTPGLVNAHDHLDFNCFPPYAPHRPYGNAGGWYSDVRADGFVSTVRSVIALPRKYRLLAGGFKNLLSGVTTAAHHNPPARVLRGRSFPVRVPREVGYCHSLAIDPRPADSLPDDLGRPWVIHAAEGTDTVAAGELSRLSSMGCLRSGTVLVHCLGIDPATDPLRLAVSGASVVWCPSSNDFLYRAAAPVRLLLEHCTVALGTDSTISGGSGMLDELRAARQAEPGLEPGAILEMATSAGAALFRQAPDRGAVVAGAIADLALFRLPAEPGADPLLAPFEARRPSLVVRDGIPLLAEPAFRPLMESLKLSPRPFEIEGQELWMPRRLHRIFACTVEVTRGWPPFGGAVQLD
jgi:hypothetical protein